MTNTNATTWQTPIRYGDLNRAGNPDPRNTLTLMPQELASIDIQFGRNLKFGRIEIRRGL